VKALAVGLAIPATAGSTPAVRQRRGGTPRLRALAHRAAMRRFWPVTGIWGLSRIDADDQARYFLDIDEYVAPRHRAYAMHLLNSITPTQRWGISRVKPSGWRLYFKGGWGSGTGWVDHQGRAPDARGRTRLGRDPHAPRRQPCLRRGDAPRDRGAASSGA